MKSTPIESVKNIGPVTASELISVGIDTFEKLEHLGWEEAFYKVLELYPHRLNVNFGYGLMAALEGVDWRQLDDSLKSEIKNFVYSIKREQK